VACAKRHVGAFRHHLRPFAGSSTATRLRQRHLLADEGIGVRLPPHPEASPPVRRDVCVCVCVCARARARAFALREGKGVGGGIRWATTYVPRPAAFAALTFSFCACLHSHPPAPSPLLSRHRQAMARSKHAVAAITFAMVLAALAAAPVAALPFGAAGTCARAHERGTLPGDPWLRGTLVCVRVLS